MPQKINTLGNLLLPLAMSGVLLLGAAGSLFAEEVDLRTLFCPLVAAAPTVDGVVTEEEWQGGTVIEELSYSRQQEEGTSRDTRVRLLADASTLYIAFECGGPDGKPKNPQQRGRDESRATDNVVTLLLDLNHDHQSLQQFSVDYFGMQSDAFNAGTRQKGGGDQTWNGEWRSAVSRGESSWTVEMAIPVEELTGSPFTPGQTLGINVLRHRPDEAHSVYLETSPLASSRFYWAHVFADLVIGQPRVAVSKLHFPAWRQGSNRVGMELHNYSDTAETVDITARVSSMVGEETWATQNVTLEPDGTAQCEIAGHLRGDAEQRLDLSLARSGMGDPLYSASYNQLSFGPKALQFLMTEAFDEQGQTWKIVTGNRACFQPDPFVVELYRLKGSTNDESLRVRTELRTRDTGKLLWAAEYSAISGNKVRAEVDTSDLPDGSYLLDVAILRDGGAKLLRTAHQFVCIGEESGDVRSRLSKLKDNIGQHAERAESLNFSRSSFLFFEYLVEEAARLIEDRDIETYRANLKTARELLAEAEKRAESFDQFQDPLAGKTGLVQRAYVSPYSRDIRTYTIFIPSTYDGTKPLPLVTDFLWSGPTPDWRNARPNVALDSRQPLELLEQKGFLMLWTGPTRRMEAEVNFFAILEELKRDYFIITDRIYLTGVSGGGLTAWTIGLRYPDQIAAICPISSVSVRNVPPDWPYLNSSDLVRDHADDLADWPQLGSSVILKARSAYYFPMNALHVPVLILHGDADTSTPVDVQARPIVKRMRELGLDVEYVEYPGEGHGLGESYADGFSRALDFFDKHRNIRHPNTIDYTTPSLRYHKAYWLRIGAFREEGVFARIQAEADTNTIRVTTENVASFTVLRDAEVFNLTAPVTVIIDEQRAIDGRFADTGGLGFTRGPQGRWEAKSR